MFVTFSFVTCSGLSSASLFEALYLVSKLHRRCHVALNVKKLWGKKLQFWTHTRKFPWEEIMAVVLKNQFCLIFSENGEFLYPIFWYFLKKIFSQAD